MEVVSVYYWYSPSQEKVTDTLNDFHYVQVEGAWRKYTEATKRRQPGGTWPDYELVAHGTNLPTRHEKNPKATSMLGTLGIGQPLGEDGPARRW